jgi:Tfp pilus assembly protein PilO
MRKNSKDTLVGLGLIAALAAAAAVAVYLPQRRRLIEVRTAIATQKSELEAQTSKVRAVPALIRQVQTMRASYRGFDRRLPRSRDLFEFLEQIGASLDAAKLTSRSIEPGQPTAQELFHTLPIIFRCAGGYAELTDFLTRLTQMERLTRIHRLSMRADPRSEALDIELQVNIYFTER